MRKFPNYIQPEQRDCGPTCLKIISKYYGKILSIQHLRQLSETNRRGSSLLHLSEAAEKIGYRAIASKISKEQLQDSQLPCILHWNNSHYVVLYAIKKTRVGYHYMISDPAKGLLTFSEKDFLQQWIPNSAELDEGIALFIEPTPRFYEIESEEPSDIGFSFLTKYIKPYKKFIFQIILGLVATSILQLISPFLTQSIVDIGIQTQSIDFIYLVLIAQLFLFVGRTALEFVRSWMLLNLSSRINIAMLSDFFIKLMNLNISFFDNRVTGDIMQKISDYNRIQRIMTNSSLSVLFSVLNIVIIGTVLLVFNFTIFSIYFIGSMMFFGWIILFLKKRKSLDNERFKELTKDKNKVIELTNGMQDIKLHNAEQQQRWKWEYIQVKLFKISIKSLKLEQTQNIGSNFINELKNIIIIFYSAKLVISGDITLGMMLAISSIVGSLNAPIVQLIMFIRELQDAKLSLERLSEIHSKDEEHTNDHGIYSTIHHDKDICINNVTFSYTGSTMPVIKNLDLTIPAKKITAIVGSSGSGKTTLMKMLLKFYNPSNGEISIGGMNLKNISHRTWRDHVGAVLQEGHLFNDTIAHNIALGDDLIDTDRLHYAAYVANLDDFIDSLPQRYNTKVGIEGVGISTGQKQRLFIARAVYKNPQILFFDEATSSLDANNEKEIMEKLDTFFEGRTVIIIAHRLSTVINADQIVVVDKGQIIEIGTHDELVSNRGSYFKLVKNQLQLGV